MCGCSRRATSCASLSKRRTKTRIVGEVWVDDFHCDIAAHARLGRAVHDPEATLTELLAELVAPQRSRRGSLVEAGVTGRDHALELDQLA